jgi:predicted transcriptional regulator
VAADKSGQAHVWRPLVSRDKLVRNRAKSLVSQVCDGAAAPVVLALLKGQRFSAEEIAEFRRLLDELENS